MYPSIFLSDEETLFKKLNLAFYDQICLQKRKKNLQLLKIKSKKMQNLVTYGIKKKRWMMLNEHLRLTNTILNMTLTEYREFRKKCKAGRKKLNFI